MRSLRTGTLRARIAHRGSDWLLSAAIVLCALQLANLAIAQQPVWTPSLLKTLAEQPPATAAAAPNPATAGDLSALETPALVPQANSTLTPPPPAPPRNQPIPANTVWNPPPVCLTQGIGGYFRAGPTIPLGHDPFVSNHDAGIAIEAGVRQRIAGGPYEFAFIDLGGSFFSARGNRTTTTPGFVQNNLTNARIDLNNCFDSTLLDVRTGTVDMAIGTYFHPLRLLGFRSRAVRAMIRGGGRYGAAWGRFHDVVTSDLATAIASLQSPGATVGVHSLYRKTNTIGGLFFSGGFDWIISRPDPRCSNAPFVTLGAEAEYIHDWVRFQFFSKNPIDAIAIMANTSIVF